MKEVFIIEKSSYFGEGGLIEVDLGLATIPQEVAEHFVKIGVARYPDVANSEPTKEVKAEKRDKKE